MTRPFNPAKSALLFPGQGSQKVGMGRELAQGYSSAEAVFKQADQELSYPLSALAWSGPEEVLNDTIHTQPALLVHSIAALSVLDEHLPGFTPRFTAGHSLGQISALVAAGALDFKAALLLTRRRGELMKAAGETHPGGMTAVLGLDISVIEDLCAEVSDSEHRVQVANDNCPGQVVVSGAQPALDLLVARAKRAGAKKVVHLPVSIPAHSYLMAQAQAGFNHAVENASIRDPVVPVVGNVKAASLTSADEIAADLKAQLTSRVRWTESITFMIAEGIETFIEVGTGGILSALIKRIDRGVTRVNISDPEDFTKV